MIKIIMGPKGSGKTKSFIDKVNVAIKEEKGNVVCIAKGNRHLFDVKSSVRLVDTADFDMGCYNVFYGFICGIISRDFDITHIFIDSVTKIANDDYAKLDEFLNKLEVLSEKFNISFTLTVSAEVSNATETMKKYLIEL